MAKLSRQQNLFVHEYLADPKLDATQAAIKAGYKEKCANRMGYNLLNKPHVKEAIDQAMTERVKRLQLDADKVLREIDHIAFDDISNYLEFYSDEVGQVKIKLKDSKSVDTRSISEVSINQKGTFTFKLYSKDNALVHLGKHLGLFANDGVTVNVNTSSLEGKNEDELQIEADRLIAEIRGHKEGTGTPGNRGKVAVLRPPQKTGEVS